MSGRRAAFGVALKNARRNKKRTFYLVALIGLPVLVAVVTAAVIRASYISPLEQATSEYGSANVKIDQSFPTPAVAEWVRETIEEVDPEASLLSYRQDFKRFGPESFGSVTDADLDDPLSEGILSLTEGSLPGEPGEVVLSEHLAAALELDMGETTTFQFRGSEESTYVVVGLASHPILWNIDQVVVAPEEMELINTDHQVIETLLVQTDNDSEFGLELNQRWEAVRYDFYPDNVEWPMPEELGFLPEDYYAVMTEEELDQTLSLIEDRGEQAASDYAYGLFQNGVTTGLPQVYAETLSDRLSWDTTSLAESPPVIGTAVAAVILAEVAFIAGAAFATGTRRRLREIGLLGANGASTEHVRTSVVSEGFLAGLGGGLLGSGVAAALLIFGRPVLQRFVPRRIEDFPLSAVDLAGPIVVAVIACVIAAWLPAKTASLVPTLTALQGRMPVGAPKRWIVPVGLVVTAFGTLLLGVGLGAASGSGGAVATIGAVLMIGGMALLAGPLVAWVSKHAERFPITSRIVLRDSGRQRGRAAAAVAATMVIMMAPVAALAAIGSSEASSAVYGLPATHSQVLIEGRFDENYELVPYTQDDLAEVRAILPDARIAEFAVVGLAVEYPAELEARKSGVAEDQGGYYIGPNRVAVINDELSSLLDDARLSAVLERDGMALIGVEERQSTISLDGDEITISEVPLGVQRYSFPRVILTEEVADGLGAVETGRFALVEVDSSLRVLFGGSPFDGLWRGDNQFVTSGGGSDLPQAAAFAMVFLGTMLIVLIVVATITALSAAEADTDLRTVVAVGATNSIRRRYLGLQSGLHTLMGALLALPLTLLLWKTVTMSSGAYMSVGNFGVWDSSGLYVPWAGIALLVIGLPVAIGLITAASVRSAPTTPPHRAT
jgi:ABC-type lipoprotein release transport system permease subunit